MTADRTGHDNPDVTGRALAPGVWDWLLVLVHPTGAVETKRVTAIPRPRAAVEACWPQAVPGASVAVLNRAGMIVKRFTPSELPAHAGKWTTAQDTPGWQARDNPPTTFGATRRETETL